MIVVFIEGSPWGETPCAARLPIAVVRSIGTAIRCPKRPGRCYCGRRGSCVHVRRVVPMKIEPNRRQFLTQTSATAAAAVCAAGAFPAIAAAGGADAVAAATSVPPSTAPSATASKSPKGPIPRVGGPSLKISLNAYSFSKMLNDFNRGRGPGMSLIELLHYCAKLNFDGLDPTGYFFP